MKTYPCPYCKKRYDRPSLIAHLNKHHQLEFPKNYTAIRVAYDSINHIQNGHGRCRICGNPTEWNDYRYKVLCNNPKCKEKMREEYKRNMLRVRGTYNILNDPEQQKVMLANRHISGVYKHSDGGEIGYTGEYEKKFLEFIDTFLEIPSSDIISPGPTMQYMYNGQSHIYIPDFYYLPMNLIIEIKDGGDNVNGKVNTVMRATREKTIEKERIITDRGEYNYIRLTNNQFEQLIDVFMTIKEKLLNGDESMTVKIHETYVDSIINNYFAEGTIEN